MENPNVTPETGFNFQKRTGLNRAVSHVARKQPPRAIQRHKSLIAFENLILCEICHNTLKDNRMLSCQHTFCLDCLDSHFMSTNTSVNKDNTKKINVNFDQNTKFLICPVCKSLTPLENGYQSISTLPKNMQVEKLLKLVAEETVTPSFPNYNRCAKCQTVGCETGQCCVHCMQSYCSICWPKHQLEVEENLNDLLTQLAECDVKLNQKLDQAEIDLSQLVNLIEGTTISKITEIKEYENQALNEVKMLKSQNINDKNMIIGRIKELKEKINKNSTEKSDDKIATYMKFHKETSKLLQNIQHFGEVKVKFNSNTFKLEKDGKGNQNLFRQSVHQLTSQSKYVMKNSSKPKLVWEKCPRPGHVAISPWDTTKLYIAATDNRNVLIMSIDKMVLLDTLTSSEMLYPQGLAFSVESEEIFVSDRWKHCVHVFSRNGKYSRSIGSKGQGPTNLMHPDGIAIDKNDRLYICDSGNDRIVMYNTKATNVQGSILIGSNFLKQPADIIIQGDKLIVADSGNHQIKIFDMNGQLLHEFGCHGINRGQFKSPETLATDSAGNILVGDAGNARIQIFESDGEIVQVLGGAHNRFQTISGICVSKNFDIIVTDNKAKCLRII